MTLIPFDTEFQVNTFTTNAQSNAAIAVDADGDFIVTWQSAGQDGSEGGIYAQRYSSDGVAVGDEFQVNTFTTNTQFTPAIAADSEGNFVITWQSAEQDGAGTGIYAQRYSSDGTALGGEFLVTTVTVNNQSFPSIAMEDDGDFVIAWQGAGEDGDGYGIYAQRFSADGNLAGDEFLVNTSTTGEQTAPVIAIDGEGDFIIAWQSEDQDGNSYGIYAQQYSADGTTVGDEFLVNSFTTGGQTAPAIAADANGNFVIAWQSTAQDGDGSGIYAQQYSADGTAVGDEFLVNSFTTGAQFSPSVAMSAGGDFAITWASSGQDGDSDGIYAQYYSADGTALGDEFLVNTVTASAQSNPAIAASADGNFVLAWESFQDGANRGVYAQRYTAPSSVEFSQATYQVNEDGTVEGAEITLTRTNDQLAATVAVALTGGTATAGTDYTATDFPLEVTFAEGETSATIAIPILQDTIVEATETIEFSVTALTNATIGELSSATLSILDDDKSPGPGDDDDDDDDDDEEPPIPDSDDDIIKGTPGDDKLKGGVGNDIIFGKKGNDRLKGGDDNDRLLGQNGNDKLLGGDGNDELDGSKGNDKLKGGNGTDTLDGGKGTNKISGGKGKDLFVLDIKGLAIISDFSDGKDTLGLTSDLKFKQLDISQNKKDTLIEFEGDLIGQLEGVKSDSITKADFVSV